MGSIQVEGAAPAPVAAPAAAAPAAPAKQRLLQLLLIKRLVVSVDKVSGNDNVYAGPAV